LFADLAWMTGRIDQINREVTKTLEQFSKEQITMTRTRARARAHAHAHAHAHTHTHTHTHTTV